MSVSAETFKLCPLGATASHAAGCTRILGPRDPLVLAVPVARLTNLSLSPSLGPLDAGYLDAAWEEARLHGELEVVARRLPVADDVRHVLGILAQADPLGTHLRPQRVEVELRLVACLLDTALRAARPPALVAR
eukprot:scaffold70157_cov55-Phaeocystis_antarctica.AAC.4